MPQVSALDDYLPCPALSRWLPARLEGLTVRHWIPPPRLSAPRSLCRVARQWPELQDRDEAIDAVVIVGTLKRPPAVQLVEALPPSTLLIDLASVGGLRLGERLFGIAARRSTRRATARRLEAWLAVGLADVEQWITTDPPDTCVTVGYRP